MRLERHVVVQVMVSVTTALSACDSGGTECDCSAAGISVNLPQALAGQVTQIATSGEACAEAVISPAPDAAPTATVFHVAPTEAGPCSIDIFFRDGTTFSDDLTVVETTGCCGGFRTTPPGAAQIGVPAPGDAGG
jgi:hypothetical protein